LQESVEERSAAQSMTGRSHQDVCVRGTRSPSEYV
jgi:hypothetical protein